MEATHTPGPWRWELSLQSKRLHLVGGLRPQYDLTIIDFDRWGMGNATMSLRDTAHDGMNLMHKLHERPDWYEPFPGRAHHRRWCQNVIHPDARLIAAAPDLLVALTELVRWFATDDDMQRAGWANCDVNAACDAYDKAKTALAKATGAA